MSSEKQQKLTELAAQPLTLPALPAEQMMSLSLSQGTTDAVNVAVALYEKLCQDNLAEGGRKLQEQKKALEAAEDALKEQTAKAAETLVQDVVAQFKAAFLAAGLTAQHELSVSLRSGGSQLIAADARVATIEIRVFESVRVDSYGYSSSSRKSYHNNVSFSRECSLAELEAYEQYELVHRLKCEQEETGLLLSEWRRKLSNISSVERQARAAMTSAVLRSNQTGRQLLASMVNSILPQLTQGAPMFVDGLLEESLSQFVSE